MNKKTRAFAFLLFLLWGHTVAQHGRTMCDRTGAFPVTVTPSDVLPVDPLGGGAQQASTTEIILSENIEDEGEAWHVFEDGGDSLWVLQNVDSPSLRGASLQCSITGGDTYSGVHCYKEFDPIEGANSFKLDMEFQFTPATTCNNEGSDSVVQAIEFSMSKWKELRPSWGQWQNVGRSEWRGSQGGMGHQLKHQTLP
ncbi:MAG: hypothetical protein IPO22_21950 [Anaerolineales bacterium]|nr:hypothetical protein [Anaerolineales bacterium]